MSFESFKLDDTMRDSSNVVLAFRELQTRVNSVAYQRNVLVRERDSLRKELSVEVKEKRRKKLLEEEAAKQHLHEVECDCASVATVNSTLKEEILTEKRLLRVATNQIENMRLESVKLISENQGLLVTQDEKLNVIEMKKGLSASSHSRANKIESCAPALCEPTEAILHRFSRKKVQIEGSLARNMNAIERLTLKVSSMEKYIDCILHVNEELHTSLTTFSIDVAKYGNKGMESPSRVLVGSSSTLDKGHPQSSRRGKTPDLLPRSKTPDFKYQQNNTPLRKASMDDKQASRGRELTRSLSRLAASKRADPDVVIWAYLQKTRPAFTNLKPVQPAFIPSGVRDLNMMGQLSTQRRNLAVLSQMEHAKNRRDTVANQLFRESRLQESMDTALFLKTKSKALQKLDPRQNL
jgi:hypothetical protein